MKFKLLSVGNKFEYQGEIFVKVSPIIASNVETGHNKMIPAYASLKLLEHSLAEKEIKSRDKLKSEDVLKAFNTFYESCLNLLEDKTALDVARDKFMQSII